ncbi:MAG: DedA family protein [Longimicrobiales bacterium]|nr:DedA family protein [Longimicrobiales bacterium]
MSQALALLGTLPAPLLTLLLSGGAFLENLVPPIPADTFVVVGGLLAARGEVPAAWVMAGVWTANVAGALAVYATGLRHGRTFFDVGMGRHLLDRGQLRRISAFYGRWGVTAIFLARFLPGLRAVVPAFAGVSHLPARRVVPPLLVASGIWYGVLLWLGMQAGRQLGRVEEWLAQMNLTLALVALGLGLLVGWWWMRSRGRAGGDRGDG